jgi:electron transport complex protein RnfG
MRDTIRYGFILALICSIASGLLASVNSLTKPKILEQERTREEDSLREVFSEGVYFEPLKQGEEVVYYKVYDKDDKFMGLAFKAAQKGYSSTIETMVGMTKDGVITNIKIINQNETPGLGNRITEPSFLQRFSKRNIQNLNEVEAITGATISSRAVIEAVNKKAEEIERQIKDER